MRRLVIFKEQHFVISLVLVALILLTIASCGNNDNPMSTGNATVPVVNVYPVVGITQSFAECAGGIMSDGGAMITSRGVCWSTKETPTVDDNVTVNSDGKRFFRSVITGLVDGTVYYVRAFATNGVGTGYSAPLSFTTLASSGTITDIDGNTYQTVTIGSQVWMAEHLKVTHYRNGDSIVNVISDSTWRNLTTGAYCNWDNDTAYAATYGKIYNWYAVADQRNIAPEGWHVPTDAEWKQLEIHLGLSQADADLEGARGSDEGGKLKVSGYAHWEGPNLGATNESGFSALPAGTRRILRSFSFSSRSVHVAFWSSTEATQDDAWSRHLDYQDSRVARYSSAKGNGKSVRCIRD